MPGKRPELRLDQTNHVPGHVIGADSEHSLLCQPARSTAVHARTRQVTFRIVPVTPIARSHQHHITRLDSDPTLCAARLELSGSDSPPWLQLIDPEIRRNVE